ncbi:DUF5937 family protein [Microbacterium sp. YY-01]|uniref:ArsR/SmtB family transcription factor n=1 Tax=Microbacterium sp. YY-01 TaxID=3421634 RepID=UPI003D16A717
MTWTLLLPARSDDCVARYSELAELGAMLHAACFSSHHPNSHELVASWFSEVDTSLMTLIREWEPVWGPYRARYMLPLSMDPGMSFEAEIEAINKLPVETFVDFTMRAIVAGVRTPSNASSRGTYDEQFLARAERMSPVRGKLAAYVRADPAAARKQLVELLTRVRAGSVIDREFSRVSRVLRARSHAMTSELRNRGLAAITSTSPMATLSADGSRVVFDKQSYSVTRSTDGLLLLPSHHLHPHIVVKGGDGYPALVHYPPRNENAVPYAMITQRLKALHDPTRRLIIRELLRQPRPTVDLGLELRMTEPQISRHLRVLRDAGIVSASREGRIVRYRVEQSVIEHWGADLIEALNR